MSENPNLLDPTDLIVTLVSLQPPPFLPDDTLHIRLPGDDNHWFDPDGKPLLGTVEQLYLDYEQYLSDLADDAGGDLRSRTVLRLPGTIGLLTVSTVYLMHNVEAVEIPGPALIWETMVVGPGVPGWRTRYCTRAAAQQGHHNVVATLIGLGLRQDDSLTTGP